MNKTTINSLHKKKMTEFEEDEQRLPEMKQTLASLKEKLAVSENACEQKDLDIKIKETEADIERIERQKMDYLVQNSDLMYKFNEMCKTRSVVYTLDSLKQSDMQRDDKPDKMDYYHKYRSNVDQDYVHVTETFINEDNYCYECKTFRVIHPDDGYLLCEKCGTKTTQCSNSEKPSLKDPAENRFYEYKRYTHFSGWLDNLQGKENVVLPQFIIDTILKEIHRERKSDRLDEVTEEDIRRYLKKYKKTSGFDRYYDHVTQILFRVTDIKPITMTSAQEQNLKLMFLQVQEPFELFKLDRSNFSSYAYIIYKFCQLLGYKEFLPKLKLHKNQSKLYEHDMIWKKICEYLGGKEKGWTFIKSYEY
jgi:hypothetical protein